MPDFTSRLQAIYGAQDMRRIEARYATEPLMERAGLAVAELAREIMGDRASPLVLAGPGNNGGDAFVAACHLRQWWFDVTLVFTGKAKKLSRDAARGWKNWVKGGGQCLKDIPSRGKWNFVIDGLFGIGLTRDVDSRHDKLIARLHSLKLPILSIDIPSGLDGDTGRICGNAVKATYTLTFMGLKPGLLTLNGPDCCGQLHLASLQTRPDSIPTKCWQLDSGILTNILPHRPANSHKGMYGNVGVLGGAKGMVGAALLAGRAALKLGAGRVYVSMLDTAAPAVDPVQPELMLRPPDELFRLDNLNCLIVGPGLGRSPDARVYVHCALKSPFPLVLDADALYLIGQDLQLQKALRTRSPATLLTPHPAEAAVLLQTGSHDIQRDRLYACATIAKRYNSHVVLKGCGSICASPDGRTFINTSGNPGMSSAGMGDVLSGMAAALLAQGVPADHALCAAVYLHGAAADRQVSAGVAPLGLSAGETIDAARHLLNQSLYGSN